MNVHSAGEAIARGREAARERTVVVGASLLLRDFLPVRIVEHDGHVAVGDRVVGVLILEVVDANALELDGLAGSVERAIGEEDGLLLRRRVVRVVVKVAVVSGRKALLLGPDDDHVGVLVAAGEGVHAVLVGGRGVAGEPAAVVVAEPDLNLGPFDGHAAGVVGHEAFDRELALFDAVDDGEVRDPQVGVGDDVVGRGERLVVAGDEVVEAGREPLGSGERLGALVVVERGGQVAGEAHHGIEFEQGLLLRLIELFGPP